MTCTCKARREEQVCRCAFNDFQSRELPPDLQAERGDRAKALLARLDDPELEQIVHWKVAGFGNEEISLMLGCTVRTVEHWAEPDSCAVAGGAVAELNESSATARQAW